MTPILYLFADTNLFIQCRVLAELDWSTWGSLDEIHLIVSRPVQREIDYRKNKGSDRAADRARATNALFRELLQSDKDHLVIRETGPCVKLYIKPEYSPDPALAERLDYNERDDQIIGTIATFRKQPSDADVRLLTHDGTPIATAKSLGIPVAIIPDAWLLPPETTDAEKKVKALQTELARLKQEEPQVKIGCLNEQDQKVETLAYLIELYSPLADEELGALMQRIKDRFPIATDFGSAERAERPLQHPGLAGFAMFKEVYVPATEKEIAAYRDEQYPKWLNSCRSILRDHHTTINHLSGQPSYHFGVVNEGTRPGKDVLVTIEAKGNFGIRPLSKKTADNDDDEQRDGAPKVLELPRPPAPPCGRWRTDPGTAFGMLEDMFKSHDLFRGPGFDPLMPRLTNIEPFRRDPNSFYYKPSRPMMPVSSYSLECAQWRHGADDWRVFSGEIYFTEAEGQIAGALECRIHAENLSDAALLRIPVRISITTTSIRARAEMLVDALIGPSPSQQLRVS